MTIRQLIKHTTLHLIGRGQGRVAIVALCLMFLWILPSKGQEFFNLTADEVRIDSVLPHFSHSVPLGDGFRDTTYTVQLLYPEFIDMSQADIARYMDICGEPLQEMPKVEQNIVLDRKRGSLEISFCPIVLRNGRYQILVSFMLDVKKAPLSENGSRRIASHNGSKSGVSSPRERYAEHSVLANGHWAKIRVPATGVYQLTNELIRRAGFTDLNKVKVYGYGGNLQNESLEEEDLIAFDDLKEMPTCTVNGRRLFHAKGPVSWNSKTTSFRTRNPYSDYGYYFITQNDAEPATVDSETFIASFYPSNDDYHVLHEVDDFAWYHGGRNLFQNDPISEGQSKTYTLDTPVDEAKGKVYVAVSAGTKRSEVEVTFNDESLGRITITMGDYDKGNVVGKTFSVSNIQTSNQIKLRTLSGGPVRLDYISITQSNPHPAPDLMAGTFAVPEYVNNITNQDLHGDGAYDMLIVIPTSQKLRKQAERLAEFHKQHDGLRVRVLPADELFNEFSSGTPDANAYRRYLKMQYDRAESDADLPRYLLLFGDCAWDNRMNTADWKKSSPDDYLLCFESENSFSETRCYIDDGFFCLLDDGEGTDPMSTDKLDMAVGRFPVTSETEAKVMVDKVIAYVNNRNSGAWQNTLVFMGDDGNQNLHMNDVNAAATQISSMYPGFFIKKVMWDAYKRETSSTGNTYPEVSRLIKQYQNNGALIMDYAGHGRAEQISHEAVLKLEDFQQFNHTNLPIWITASCDIMPFDGLEETIGETAVLNSKGGAIAFFGTTRTVYASGNKLINMAFLRHVLTIENGKPISIGEAQRRAKNEMITSKSGDKSENKLQYSLLGDPAVALHLPTMEIEIDSINGMDATAATTKMAVLKAGSIAKLKGHVKGASDNFNGVVTVTVRDNEERIVCRQNDRREADTAYVYRDRTKILFSGSDSIVGGKFEFKFAVPKDINYSNATGLINVYAVNNEHTINAHGQNSRFLVGGSDMAGNDSIGPSIYCYLNSPSFTNGGNVNSTPYFVAQIKDEDGINATGNGIGHDLELIIDGDMTKTYVLNDNFQYDFGSYTSGNTYYNIPELEEGPHTLLFRAWDVLNNSSTTQLSFNVVKGLQPSLFCVSCTNNPATTETTFIITHDRTGSEMDVEVEIFDVSGRLLWKHAESGLSMTGAYTVDWDLTVDGGRRLQTGVYLYRVRVASDGSSKASKAKKLIILGNN